MSGAEMALRLFGAFRSLVDDLHDELARRGHPHVRPVHGFALQALGPDGATASELAVLLGVSKQAAGKTVNGLAALGYVERTTDPGDARRRTVVVTASGQEVLRLSAEIFERGLICRADDRGDPVVQLSPPLIAGPEQFEEIEGVLRPVLEEASRRMLG